MSQVTYLAFAVRIELQRRQLEATYGKGMAPVVIAGLLQQFKDLRSNSGVAQQARATHS